jgi:hypothetical protein
MPSCAASSVGFKRPDGNHGEFGLTYLLTANPANRPQKFPTSIQTAARRMPVHLVCA